ncbi:MAG: penicillin-binding protein 2 [Chloroflexota bacterium]|nr:penicillin-binding protein 2 [Chloroflexota bacterium]
MTKGVISGWRIMSLFCVFALITSAIGWRLVSFQVVGSERLQSQGRDFRVQEQTLLPRRGLIRDRGGLVLATNIPSTDIYVTPKKLTDRDRVRLAQELSAILTIPLDTIYARVNNTDVEWSLVARQLDDPTVAAIKARFLPKEHPEIVYQEVPKRTYPNGPFLSPLLGFTNAGGMGVYGVEGRYNDLVGGEPGILVAETDVARQPLAFGQQQYRAPVEGADLSLTIDAAIQRMAEDELTRTISEQGALGGTILVMDPNTGAILASASAPSYDPNAFNRADPQSYLNPAVSATYEPGSTFKIFTMAAGLQTGGITPQTTLVDNGFIKVDPDTLYNLDHKAWGPETMEQVLERSSNVGASYIAKRTGKENFYSMLRQFGMGQKTGVDLDGEEIGIVRWPDNPTTIWNPIDLYTNSFGQGLTVTPLQMVTAASAIANGGTLYTPYVVGRIERHGDLVQDHRPQPARQVISPEVAATVRQMMTEATHKALADKVNLPGYDIAAKTGTAQIPDPKTGRYVEDKTIASIISFFPANKPLFTVLVKIDQPKKNSLGGDVAAPALGRLAGELLRYAGVPPAPTTRKP